LLFARRQLRKMRVFAVIVLCLVLMGTSRAQEHGRLKRKPPNSSEADRIASELVMNDSLLQKGDIVVTDRGFLMFLGLASDGYTYEFAPVPSPLGRPSFAP
jgi:hypothetical protein